MLLTVAAIIAGGALLSQPQTTAPPRPIVRLVDDLDVAMTRAHLSETQKTQLQSDRGVLETAREAKEQGQPVNRRQVGSAVKSLHEIVESGAFTAEDRQTLNADIEVLRKQ